MDATATPMRIDHNKEDILAPFFKDIIKIRIIFFKKMRINFTSLVRTAKPPMIDTKIPAPATKNGNATAKQ